MRSLLLRSWGFGLKGEASGLGLSRTDVVSLDGLGEVVGVSQNI